jgi:hypothetical protein
MAVTPKVKEVTGPVKVKNLSNKTLNLTGGQIAPGKTGTASPAEVSMLYKYLERV